MAMIFDYAPLIEVLEALDLAPQQTESLENNTGLDIEGLEPVLDHLVGKGYVAPSAPASTVSVAVTTHENIIRGVTWSLADPAGKAALASIRENQEQIKAILA